MKTLIINEQENSRKHPIVFETFDGLEEGNAFIIKNDHDPKPLYYQMVAHLGEVFDWEYTQQGGTNWEVKISKLKHGEKPKSLGELTTTDYRRAKVFEKFGLDFCCGGDKTLFQACSEKGLDVFTVEAELQQASEQEQTEHEDDCNCWQLDVLVDYIVKKHHAYVKEASPEIKRLVNRIIEVHGNAHPELQEVGFNFQQVANELDMHMIKEENALFPYIKQLEAQKTSNAPLMTPPFGTIKNPIYMMKAEHDEAGEVLETLKSLTNNYTPPNDACNTYRAAYDGLKAFDADLRRHIHLENNILFPKAVTLEEELLSAQL